MKRRVLPIVIALLLVPGVALADPPKNGADPAAAQGLFYDARTLMQAGKFSEACPKLEESLRLDPGIGTQFNLADCNEHLGKTATAWAGFLEVAAESKIASQPDREKLARKRAAALVARLPKLVVDVSGAPQGVEVRRDGSLIGAAAWGTPIPVDPGVHRISARAPGKQPWETTVETTEAKTSRVVVPRDLPAGVAAGTTTSEVAQQPVANGVTTTASTAGSIDSTRDLPPRIAESRGVTQRTLGWVLTGLGAAGVGVGAGFGLSSIAKRSESRTHCAADACDAAGVSLRDDAIRNGNIATIATIAGGAAVAGGLIVVLTAPSGPSTHERAGRMRAAPTVAIGGGGLMLQGVFQ